MDKSNFFKKQSSLFVGLIVVTVLFDWNEMKCEIIYKKEKHYARISYTFNDLFYKWY